ncbi:MAG: SUMF1/EgtB/PvdO family nonheme iron enzyme [Myxococcota bacterium]|nr:SUMF1/EgtB/PvdO family nonheme iron enzyme [Myxococcota bacterium]
MIPTKANADHSCGPFQLERGYMRFALTICALTIFACGEAEDANLAVDQGVVIEADAATSYNCNETTRRAEVDGELTCRDVPETVTIDDNGRRFEIFKYEASHPLASSLWAFPCATVVGDKYEAPDQPTEACSKANVIPWHSVRWADANAACEAIGWRLCRREELMRACQGPNDRLYTYGSQFEGGACNVRDAYRDPGQNSSTVAPTGHFSDCVSSDGANDLTGNLWEWSSDRDEADGSARFYYGAGWKTIAERHRDRDQACDVESRIPGVSARSFIKEYVGFRCCRNAQ